MFFFEPVNPEKIKRALLKLKEVNHLYADVNIDTSVIPFHLASFNENILMKMNCQII